MLKGGKKPNRHTHTHTEARTQARTRARRARTQMRWPGPGRPREFLKHRTQHRVAPVRAARGVPTSWPPPTDVLCEPPGRTEFAQRLGGQRGRRGPRRAGSRREREDPSNENAATRRKKQRKKERKKEKRRERKKRAVGTGRRTSNPFGPAGGSFERVSRA